MHVHSLLRSVTKDAVVASQRRATLASDWSTILSRLVRDAVVEISDRPDYARRCYAEETAQTATSDFARDV